MILKLLAAYVMVGESLMLVQTDLFMRNQVKNLILHAACTLSSKLVASYIFPSLLIISTAMVGVVLVLYMVM